MELVFIGGGKMAEALLGGLIATEWAPPAEFGVVEPDAARRSYLAATFPEVQLVDEARGADVLIAVKPQHVPDVASSLAGSGTARVLSIAAGVTIASLEGWLDDGTRVVRCMPNTPALVGEGAAGLAAGTTATDADLAWASSILSAVGTASVFPESQLDAVTGLSGSGPAYLFLVAEAMIAAGIDVGLSPTDANTMARQTLLGAATLLSESPEDPAQLRANVTSPGGTTAEGIKALEAGGVRDAFLAAIRAATARSVELGQS